MSNCVTLKFVNGIRTKVLMHGTQEGGYTQGSLPPPVSIALEVKNFISYLCHVQNFILFRYFYFLIFCRQW